MAVPAIGHLLLRLEQVVGQVPEGPSMAQKLEVPVHGVNANYDSEHRCFDCFKSTKSLWFLTQKICFMY